MVRSAGRRPRGVALTSEAIDDTLPSQGELTFDEAIQGAQVGALKLQWDRDLRIVVDEGGAWRASHHAGLQKLSSRNGLPRWRRTFETGEKPG